MSDKKPGDRLLEIAQRLDELAEEMPELAALSEEIGLAAEQAFLQPVNAPVGPGTVTMPRWLAEVRQVVERAMQEERYVDNKAIYGSMYRDYVRYAVQTTPNFKFTEI
jgi:hypothetical protein